MFALAFLTILPIIFQATGDEDAEDNGSECVICMSDVRDTLILPCRHLCLCNSCADSLRYQANNCPICRAPFRALLQIKTLQKCATSNGVTPASNIPGEVNIPPSLFLLRTFLTCLFRSRDLVITFRRATKLFL